MRNDPDRPRSVTPNEDLRSRDKSDKHSDRNRVDAVRQLHRQRGWVGLGDAGVAFDQLGEAYQLLRDDEPIDWSDPEWLRERTEQLRRRTMHASELEHAALEYRDALYQAGVLQRRIQRHDAALHRRVEIERLRADGTLYREEHRNQNRPAHVDVDPGAWATVKREAVQQRETVGAMVGGLVVQFTDAGVAPSHSSVRTAEHRFARLCVDDERWATLRGIAIDSHVSAARLVGLVVEAEAVRLGWRTPRGPR